jgi:hypothetical protein
MMGTARFSVRRTYRRWFVAIAAAILIVCASASTPCRADDGSARCTGPAILDCNLVQNGGFEDELGSLDIDHVVQPSSWYTSGHATVLQYGGLDGLPVSSDKDESVWRSPGYNFLAGGPAGASRRDAIVWQRIDIGPSAKRGRDSTFMLSAVLGGRAGKPDFARVWVRFLDEKMNVLTNPVGVEPVLRADRKGRTFFMGRGCYGEVPPGARHAMISIKLYSLTGWDNHAYVDNVEFTLHRTLQRKDVELCRKSGLEFDNMYKALALSSIDPNSAACLNNEYRVLTALVFTLSFLIVLCWRVGHKVEAPYSVRVERSVHIGIATTAALALTSLTWYFMRSTQPLFYARCGFGELRFPMLLPWAYQVATFCSLSALDMLLFSTVFVHWRKNLWHKSALWMSALAAAAVAALILVIVIKPTSASLDRMNAVVLVLLPFVLLAFVCRDWIRLRRWEERAVLALVLSIPVLQPLTALWNINTINAERIHESERHYFDVNVGQYRGRFTGVLYYAPTALDYHESARVVFSSHLNDTSSSQARSCIVPRFTAPGFRVEEISTDPAPLSRGRVWWEWAVTPQHDGRQFMFIDVLYSPQCKPSSTAGTRSNAGFVTVFSQTESAWVSRQWFSADNFGAALSLLSLLAGVVAVPLAILQIRNSRKVETATHGAKEEAALSPGPEKQ